MAKLADCLWASGFAIARDTPSREGLAALSVEAKSPDRCRGGMESPDMAGARKSAVAIRHLIFEDLGSFKPVLRDAGYDVSYIDASRDSAPLRYAVDADLVIVLGGPVGAYDENRYPFLTEELRLLERRLSACRPTVGICLGAQLMARALGAYVYPSGVKEIGFGPIQLTPEGQISPLRHLGQNGVVLHWHGDTFDLPAGADLLASTECFKNQAFALGAAALGLQFHPEIDASEIECWLVGHAVELTSVGRDARLIRSDARLYGRDIEQRATAFLTEWLRAVSDPVPRASSTQVRANSVRRQYESR